MLAQGLVHGEVGLGAGVGLHIGIIGAEELLGPLNGDVLHHVHALTAAVVVCVGLLGAILGFKTMKLMHVGSPIAQGLSMGTAAHAVGTSTAMDISSKYGAYASLGLTLNGIFTALLTPTILRLLGML